MYKNYWTPDNAILDPVGSYILTLFRVQHFWCAKRNGTPLVASSSPTVSEHDKGKVVSVSGQTKSSTKLYLHGYRIVIKFTHQAYREQGTSAACCIRRPRESRGDFGLQICLHRFSIVLHRGDQKASVLPVSKVPVHPLITESQPDADWWLQAYFPYDMRWRSLNCLSS